MDLKRSIHLRGLGLELRYKTKSFLICSKCGGILFVKTDKGFKCVLCGNLTQGDEYEVNQSR